MTIFFDTDTALTPQNNTSFSKGMRTDFMDNVSSAYNAFTRSELFSSERSNLAEEYINVVDILTRAGHSGFVSPLDQDLKLEPLGSGASSIFGVHRFDLTKKKSRQELEAEFWNKVTELQTTDENLKAALVEAGLDTQENMQKIIAEKTHKAWEEYQKINERASGEWYTGGGKTGGFTGIAGGAFTDPIMLATIPISFGYSVPATFGKAAWKVAKYEMIIGAVAETMIQLKAQPYRKELGFEDAGLETGLKNIAMVTAAAGVLSPVLYGVFKAFGKGVDVGKKYLFKLSDEEINQVSKELGNINPKFKDKTLDNYKIPEKDNPFPDNAAGRTEHRERLDAAVKSVNENTPLDLPPAKNHIVPDNLEPPVNLKPGEFADIFDANGNIVRTQVVKVSTTGNSIKVKLGDGTEKIIGLDPKSGAFQNIRNPNYVIRSAGLNAQGKSVSQLSKQEVNTIRKKLIERKENLEKEGRINEGAYHDTVQDLNSIDFNINKTTTNTNSPRIEKATFNKNESKLAEDIEGVKEFDVPNEAAYRNQASVTEASMFDEGTSLAIRSEAGAGDAAKTVPTGKPLAKTQDLVSKSQLTDTAPPSTVLATAQSKPPLLTRGETNKVVGDISSIGFPLYHKTDNFNEIYKTLSKKMDAVKKELQPIATKYNGDLKARIKEIKSLKEKLATKDKITPQNVSDFLGARISLDTITQAKLVYSELNKKFKLIFKDDFLDDVGRTLTHNTEYRRIHLQALTKDGFSFELQVSLKELDPLIDINHAFYKKLEYQKDTLSKSEILDLVKKQKVAEANIKNKYFKIKDKEFSRLNPTNDVDVPFVIGTRLDENGEKVPLTTTAREAFEQDAKDLTMLKRLENCI